MLSHSTVSDKPTAGRWHSDILWFKSADKVFFCIFVQGGKNRRRGKNENDNEKRELTFKEDGQEYAQVVKMLGNGRLEALCFDGERRLAHIRGKLRKKVRLTLPPFAPFLLLPCYENYSF